MVLIPHRSAPTPYISNRNGNKKDSWWLAKENSQNMFHLHSS